MRPVFLLISFSALFLSCNKDKDKAKSTAVQNCGCGVSLIDRMQFMNWDGQPDTMDIWHYDQGDNFMHPHGPTTVWIDTNGYDEGTIFFMNIGEDGTQEYKIVLRHHPGRVYKLRNYSYHQDSIDCSQLSGDVHCYNSFSYELNDSIITVPVEVGSILEGAGTHKLELY